MQDSHLSFKQKMTIRSFDEKMVSEFGLAGLTKSPYREEGYNGEKATIVHLYYFNDVHVGSHCKGKGWIFKQKVNSVD
jgi:hypothetical protein